MADNDPIWEVQFFIEMLDFRRMENMEYISKAQVNLFKFHPLTFWMFLGHLAFQL